MCHLHATILLKAVTHPRIMQERLGYSSIATTLDIYSQTVPGLQKAAAERIDTLFQIEEQKYVGKKGENESEPPGSRTQYHLTKRFRMSVERSNIR